MPRTPQRPAQSIYRGLRLNITQHPDSPVCYVNLAVKPVNGRWDDWSAILPVLKVPVRDVEGYMDVLRVAVDAVEAMLISERENR